MHTVSRVASIVLFCSAVLPSLGCGPDNPLGRLGVSGAVQLNGQPLDLGEIEFSPTAEGPNVASGGRIENGRYRIPAHQGLLPGTYLVRVSSGEMTGEPVEPEFPGDSPILARERIPAAYNVKSDKHVTVTDGGSNVFDFDIR